MALGNNVQVVGTKEEDLINECFNSIEDIILEWKPEEQRSNVGVFVYSGILVKGQKLYSDDKPLEDIPVFGVYGGSYIRVGTLDKAGTFTSDIDATVNIVIYQIFEKEFS